MPLALAGAVAAYFDAGKATVGSATAPTLLRLRF
jgi:hypothetical protein